jgi:lipoprotein-anchoring transpeptidase ErfK/SrfK
VPGLWHIFDRESPTVFKSSEPKGSAFWYPDTNINFAMAYHDGGYFLHDSWWRKDYGHGTNFPHYDSGGDESFAGGGSHGCVNMPEDQASWLYSHTGYGIPVIIY